MDAFSASRLVWSEKSFTMDRILVILPEFSLSFCTVCWNPVARSHTALICSCTRLSSSLEPCTSCMLLLFTDGERALGNFINRLSRLLTGLEHQLSLSLLTFGGSMRLNHHFLQPGGTERDTDRTTLTFRNHPFQAGGKIIVGRRHLGDLVMGILRQGGGDIAVLFLDRPQHRGDLANRAQKQMAHEEDGENTGQQRQGHGSTGSQHQRRQATFDGCQLRGVQVETVQ